MKNGFKFLMCAIISMVTIVMLTGCPNPNSTSPTSNPYYGDDGNHDSEWAGAGWYAAISDGYVSTYFFYDSNKHCERVGTVTQEGTVNGSTAFDWDAVVSSLESLPTASTYLRKLTDASMYPSWA